MSDAVQERRGDFTVDWVHLKLNDQEHSATSRATPNARSPGEPTGAYSGLYNKLAQRGRKERLTIGCEASRGR